MILWFTGQPGSGKTTLSKKFIKEILVDKCLLHKNEIIHIDGDDLRDLTDNKDYSEKGRRNNIRLAMNLAKFSHNKGYTVLVSLVSPYRDLREEIKSLDNVKEFYTHTNEVRGKESYFAENYEAPINNFTDINTSKPIEENINEIFDVYRKMATLA
jgi:adenylylsulfate kinase